jgi:hypothetical protein
MGVTVSENIDLKNGLTVNSYYASINTNTVRTRKTMVENTDSNVITTRTIFDATAELDVWVSKEARDANNEFIQHHYVKIEQETPFNGNLYELLYARYKEDHPTAVDA